MKFALAVAFGVIAFSGVMSAQDAVIAPKMLVPPMVPMPIALPAGNTAFFRVHAKGFQDYTCSNVRYIPTWTLSGPDAQLFGDHSKQIGTHFAQKASDPGAAPSPAWKLSDGSEIVGEKFSGVEAPDGKGVQWLLLKVIKNEKRGLLADATYVQRVNTVGGKPPESGCTSATIGVQTRSKYTADYYFAK